jgi:hypothetical protein
VIKAAASGVLMSSCLCLSIFQIQNGLLSNFAVKLYCCCIIGETITVVLEGELEHHDNRGGHGVLKPGDVQWMTAGLGILHREMAYRKQQVHTLQLWLNLPADNKMVEPTYHDLQGDKVSIRRYQTFCQKNQRVTLIQVLLSLLSISNERSLE